MNIYKKSFEQKDKSAKHRKYSLTKTVTVAGDDIDLRQNKLRSLHISKSTKYKYRRSALYLKRVNKKSRIRNICTIFAYRRFRSARSFALVKLRGWRKARQLYADKLKSSLSDAVFEASELADDVYVTVYGEKSECRAD